MSTHPQCPVGRFLIHVAPGRASEALPGVCWEWTAHRKDGYGRFRGVSAHRWWWERVNGPVPPGLQLDHLCRNRGCVNPAHLEPVTARENSRRGAGSGGVLHPVPLACKRGHILTIANTRFWGRRWYCRTCVRENSQRRRKRNA